MWNKILSRVIPIALAALIVSAGFLVPQRVLQWKESQIKQSAGTVEAGELSIYSRDGYEQEVKQWISQLSEVVPLLSDLDSDNLQRREPLDTEIDAEEAYSIADQFSELLLLNFQIYGYELSYGTLYFAGSDQATASISSSSEVGLWASAEDASLALWVITRDDNMRIALDTVSGMPLYVSFSAYVDETLSVDYIIFFDLVLGAVKDTYYDLYKLTFSDPSWTGDIDGQSLTETQTTDDGYALTETVVVEETYDAGCKYRADLRLSADSE